MGGETNEAITSVNNPKVREAIRLRNPRERRRSGRFLIDGEREIVLAAQAGIKLSTIFGLSDYSFPETLGLLPRLQRVSERVLEKLSYGDQKDLPVAIAEAPEHPLENLQLPGQQCLLLVLDRIEKPGNLGACLRTALACGVEAVILNSPICELYNPNTIRASRGAVFRIPVAITTTTQLVDWASRQAIHLLAARVDGSQLLWESSFHGRKGVVFGNEAEGLGDDWREQTERLSSFRIPMVSDGVDSLNVSISVAVTLYEALRQAGATEHRATE